MRRTHFDSAIWHVFSRGVRRLELFRDEADFQEFLQFLVFALKKSGAALRAYTLMTNHYHMVIEGATEQLSSCMYILNKEYAHYHNKRYALGGHVFDGPFQAFPAKTPLLSLATIAYVFLNPVKGGLCPAPEDYPWSSYRSFVGLPGSPLPVDTTAFLNGLDPDPKRIWRLFHLGMRRELARPTLRMPGRPTMVEVHLSQFAWLFDYAQAQTELLAGEDPAEVAAWWARQSGIAPRVIAKALGRDSRAIRNMLTAFGRRLETEPALAPLAAVP